MLSPRKTAKRTAPTDLARLIASCPIDGNDAAEEGRPPTNSHNLVSPKKRAKRTAPKAVPPEHRQAMNDASERYLDDVRCLAF